MAISLNSFSKDTLGIEVAVFPPNKPLEPRAEFSKCPVVYNSLFFLDINSNGNCIIGASEVAGTFWEGTLLYFKDEKYMENFDYSGHYIYTTTSDGRFVKDNIIALAEDSGNINVLSLDEDLTLRPINYFKLIERVPQIAVWDKATKVLSCSERSIAIWDVDSIERKPCEKLDNYHTDRVLCVDTLKRDTNIFLSGGRDRIAGIWDLRAPVPISVLYANEFSSISCVSWNQDNDNYIVAGTQAGDVYLLDKREPKDFISVLHCFDATVNRIAFNNSNEFAVCGDISDVLVIKSESNSLEETYKNLEHVGPVKDVKWHKGTLYSCGFGKCLIKHINQKI